MDDLLAARAGGSDIFPPLTGPESKIKTRPKWRRLRELMERRESGPLSPALFLGLSALAGTLAILGTVYEPGYAVTADGAPLGTVAEPQVVEEVLDRVEERASAVLGRDYRLREEIGWTFTLTKRGERTDPAAMEEVLFASIPEITEGYVLRVNGEVVGAAREREALTAMLEDLSKPYETEDTVSSRLLAGVSVSREYTPVSVCWDLEDMEARLQSNRTEETTYSVQAGDTFLALAYDNGMDAGQLQALNPDVDIDLLYIGQELVMQEEVPYVSVETVDRVTERRTVDPPVERREDPDRYEDEVVVLEEGKPGEALVTEDVTYVNGREHSRAEIEREILVEPETRVVLAGTKPRPAWYPKGYFIWPVHGVITSRFGYRNIFGSTSYHGGLDIAVPYGTAVLAADGGTVLFAGMATGGNWSYGNLVILDHGNGRVTYYGHNSSILVSAGEHVAQGQAIARAGSTGRSTGNHCHFEVRLWGSRVDPLNYLS